MSFKRQITPSEFLTGNELTSALIGLGFRLQGQKRAHANIEDVIIAASFEGMAGDLRVLSLLVDWIELHSLRINADRLYRVLKELKDKRVLSFWSGISKWKASDRRFSKIERLYRGKRVDLLASGTDFHIKRHGEDPRFEDSSLRVPKKAGLRHRPSDILSPAELAKTHLPYRYRLIIGPSYRADMWAQLELDETLSASKLAHLSYGSFATAWQVKREWELINVEAA